MKINITNAAKVQATLDAAQVRCSARTLEADDVTRIAASIEHQLSETMLKKDWAGARFDVDDNAQNFPSSYTGTPESTRIELTRGTSGWFLTGCHRSITRGRAQRVVPHFSAEQCAAIADFVTSAQRWS